MILELSIGDTCIVKGGKRLPNGHQLLQSKTKHPYIRTRDLNDHKINFNEIECITPETHKEIERYIVDKGNLIISIVGTIGSCAIIPDNLDKANLTENCAKIVPKDSSVDTNFLYYYLISKIGQNEIHKNTVGSTQLKLPLYGIKNIKIPSIDEKSQSRIADFLSNLDKKIELNKKQNETLEEIAKTLFKSWFIDFDPVRAKAEGRPTGLSKEISDLFPDSFEDSELGEIPYRWSTDEVGNISECVGGGTPSTKEPLFWENGNNFWATPKDLSHLEKPFLLETSKKITNLGIQKISSRVLPIGTVLISSRAPVGYVAVAEVPLSINQGFIAIKPSEILSKEYLLNWAQANVEKFKNRASGTTFAEISKQSFRPIKILLPDEKVMLAFSDLTKIIHKRIISSMKEINNLVDMRNILLPKLISGELRITDAEKMIEEAGI